MSAEVAALAEDLLARLGADLGNWRIELFATDGALRKWTRLEDGGRDQLRRFDLLHEARQRAREQLRPERQEP
jgi:hypothetical protein